MGRVDALMLQGATFKARMEVEAGAVPESGYLENIELRRFVLELYDSEHVALRRYLTFLGVSRETARELVQEAYLKLHQHLLDGGDRSNLRAWLYRVSHNLARNVQKSAALTMTEPLKAGAAAGDFASSAPTVEQDLLRVERARGLQEAIAALPATQRECLVLRTRGMKYREIAQVLDLSVSFVAENVQRGIASMRDALDVADGPGKK